MTMRTSIAGLSLLLLGCAPPRPTDTVAAPVVAGTRRTEIIGGENGIAMDQRGEDAIMIGKIVGSADAVWGALREAMESRKVKLNVLDRAVGRMGDTSLVMMTRWNGGAVSRYLSCGATLTGFKADDERIRGVFLAQLTRMQADTIAVAVHLSGASTPVASGNSGSSTQCRSTGKAEADLIADVKRKVANR